VNTVKVGLTGFQSVAPSLTVNNLTIIWNYLMSLHVSFITLDKYCKPHITSHLRDDKDPLLRVYHHHADTAWQSTD
jgi:hypothetical protein